MISGLVNVSMIGVSADTILLRDYLLPKVGTNEHEQEGFEAAFAAQLRVRIYVCEP